MLNLLGIPAWSWIAVAIIAVVAVVLIVLIIVLSKKFERKNNGGKVTEAKKSKKSSAAEEETAVTQEKKPASKPVKSKPAEEKPAAKPAQKPAGKVYHISKRKDDGMWQIKAAGGEKAIKLFKTQKAAIDYCKTLAENQEASIMIHKEDGSFRKLTY